MLSCESRDEAGVRDSSDDMPVGPPARSCALWEALSCVLLQKMMTGSASKIMRTVRGFVVCIASEDGDNPFRG